MIPPKIKQKTPVTARQSFGFTFREVESEVVIDVAEPEGSDAWLVLGIEVVVRVIGMSKTV
jgi:hypothetical protein